MHADVKVLDLIVLMFAFFVDKYEILKDRTNPFMAGRKSK